MDRWERTDETSTAQAQLLRDGSLSAHTFATCAMKSGQLLQIITSNSDGPRAKSDLGGGSFDPSVGGAYVSAIAKHVLEEKIILSLSISRDWP